MKQPYILVTSGGAQPMEYSNKTKNVDNTAWDEVDVLLAVAEEETFLICDFGTWSELPAFKADGIAFENAEIRIGTLNQLYYSKLHVQSLALFGIPSIRIR
jgi:hypothetical protein